MACAAVGHLWHHRWKKREKNIFNSGKNTKLTAVVAGRCGRCVSVEWAPQRGDSEWTTVDSVHYAPTNAHTHTPFASCENEGCCCWKLLNTQM